MSINSFRHVAQRINYIYLNSHVKRMKITFIARADSMERIKIPREVVIARKLPKRALYNVIIEQIEEQKT